MRRARGQAVDEGDQFVVLEDHGVPPRPYAEHSQYREVARRRDQAALWSGRGMAGPGCAVPGETARPLPSAGTGGRTRGRRIEGDG